jgi:hypothetical protein
MIEHWNIVVTRRDGTIFEASPQIRVWAPKQGEELSVAKDGQIIRVHFMTCDHERPAGEAGSVWRIQAEEM